MDAAAASSGPRSARTRPVSSSRMRAISHQAIIQINRFKRLHKYRLPRGAGCVHHSRDAAAIPGAHRNHEAIVPERDVILAGRFPARAHDLFERMLNRGARLDLARTDAFQLRRSVIADFSVGHHRATNRDQERTEVGKGGGAFRQARILRGLAFECLPHRIRVFRERRNIEKFRGHEHRSGHNHAQKPRIRIGERAESKLRTRAQVGVSLAYQFEFGFERRHILPWRKRLNSAPAGHARRRAADDFLQLVEFEKLFRGARHVNLKRDCSPVACGKSVRLVQRA